MTTALFIHLNFTQRFPLGLLFCWEEMLVLLYPPNAYTMPWIRTDKIYTLIDHVLLLLLPTSYMST